MGSTVKHPVTRKDFYVKKMPKDMGGGYLVVEKPHGIGANKYQKFESKKAIVSAHPWMKGKI